MRWPCSASGRESDGLYPALSKLPYIADRELLVENGRSGSWEIRLSP